MYTNYCLFLVIFILLLTLYIVVIKSINNEYYPGSNVSVYNLPNLEPITTPPYEYHCVFDVPPYTNWCKYG